MKNYDNLIYNSLKPLTIPDNRYTSMDIIKLHFAENAVKN